MAGGLGRWAAISHLEQLPAWYPAVQQVQTLTAGDPDAVGSRVRYLIKGRLPMRLAFEATITRWTRRGSWSSKPRETWPAPAAGELQQQGEVTTVRYVWDVQTTKPWMNLVAPVVRPLFTWNSRGVMLQAGEGLARHLGRRWWTLASLPRRG